MENMNKRDRQYKDAASFTLFGFMGVGLCFITMWVLLCLSSCVGTYYLTDAEYSDVRESHASLTYYDNQIYWGWNSGYYYYYGIPHYYPWYYYYNTCPPSHYHTTTHVIISRPVNKPTHRPNRPTNRPNTIIKTNTNVKTNVNRNKVIIKTNRSNNSTKRSVKTHRKPR